MKRRVQERDDLIAKARQLAKASGGGEDGGKSADGFFRVSMEHEYDGRQRGCQGEER